METDLIGLSLKVALETSPDGVLIVSPEGRIVWLNPRAAAMFGWEIDELAGQLVERLVPAEVGKVHHVHRERYLKSAVARAMGKGIRLVGRRKDGRDFRVDIDLTPLPTARGVHVICLVRDLSQYLQV